MRQRRHLAVGRRPAAAPAPAPRRRAAISSVWVSAIDSISNPRRALAWATSRTFSRTVRLGNRLVSWKARPMPRRVRSATPAREMSSPSSSTDAGCRLELAGDQVEVGGLAGAVGADDGRQRAALELEPRRAVLISLRIRPPRATVGFAECSAQIRRWSRSSGPDEDGSLWSTGLAGAASTNTGAAHTPSHLVAEQTLTTCCTRRSEGPCSSPWIRVERRRCAGRFWTACAACRERLLGSGLRRVGGLRELVNDS